MDSRAWLAHLEQFGIKLGLDTIAAIVGALGHPERACPVLHVAGTNGKGSVSAMASHALTASGLLTACYTSPHLVRLEERFAVDGRAGVGQRARHRARRRQATPWAACTRPARSPSSRRSSKPRRLQRSCCSARRRRAPCRHRGRPGRTIRRDQHRRAAGDGDHLGGLRSPGAVGHDAGGNRRREGGHDQAWSSRGRRAAASRGARGG